MSGTVGVGNIGGVAVAISLGGPGAAFWLFIAGLLSMSTKLVECTLGVKYRRYNADGSVSGGPMFYMEAYFRERGWPGIGKGFGTFYALALVIGCLGIGNMFQSNQAFAQFVVITGGETSFFAERGWLFGLALAAVIAAVIIGGIRSIAQVAAVLVPVMGLIYVIAAVVVIGLSAEHLPAALALVVSEAFHRPGGIGWHSGCHGDRLSAGAIFQRGGYRLSVDCALRGQNRKTCLRGHHGAIGALHRYRGRVFTQFTGGAHDGHPPGPDGVGARGD